MADGRVEIDTRLETGNIRQDVQRVNNELNRIGDGVADATRGLTDEVGARYDSLGRRIRYVYRGTSEEARRMYSEMASAHRQQSIAMRGLKDQMLGVEYGYFQLAQASQSYTGTIDEFMSQVETLGAAQKSANDAMINSNRLAMISMLQTAGTMMNMTTQAQRISQNYQRMANPLYNVNRAGLAVADTMNRIANNGNAAVLALRLLGPTASMKSLLDMQRMINQGLMRFQMVALAAAATSVLLYGALHKANMEMNPQYAEAYNNMIEKLTKALQPMRDAFAAVMIPIYNFVSAIADLIIKFNEAHPVLARFIQGMIMLVPLLTLILSPLAIGIGLWAGMQAAWASIWMLIGPLVTGLMAMSGTVWLVAAALSGLAVGLTYAYKHVESFRTAIDNVVKTIKGFWQILAGNTDAGNKLLKSIGFSEETIQMLNNFVSRIKESLNTMKEAIVQAFHGNFTGLTEIFKTIFPSLLAIIIGGIPGLVLGISTMFARMSEATGVGGAQMIIKFSEFLNNLVLSLTNFVTNQLPVFLEQGVKIITGIVQGLTQALPQIVTAVLQIITTFITGLTTILPQIITIGITLIQTLVTAIVTALPIIVQAAVQIINTLVQGITLMLPAIVQSAIQVITMFIQTIIPMIPMLIQSGIQILMALINGIIQFLPQLIAAAIQIMTTLLNAIVLNLPLIIDAGIQVLNALINGIIQVLPQIIEAVLQIVTKFTEAIVQNLPRIIDSGMQILTKLIEGIIKVLPQIVDAVIKIITKFTEIIVQNLPIIIDAGVQILTKLIEGIIKVLPQLVSAAIKLMGELLKAIIQHLPQLLEAGVELIGALIDGVLSLLGEVFSSGVEIGGELLDSLGDVDLFEIGANIIEGLIDGISSMASAAWEEAKSVASGIKDAVTGFLDIHSPSRVMRDIGIYTGQGLVKGINSMENPVFKAARTMVESVKDAFGTLSNNISLGDISMGAVSASSSNKSGSKNAILDGIGDVINRIMPDIQSFKHSMPTTGSGNSINNITKNNTPISVTLNYSGNASETDMLRMVDFVEEELARRTGNQLFISGVRG